jgi:hypothetical protein
VFKIAIILTDRVEVNGWILPTTLFLDCRTFEYERVVFCPEAWSGKNTPLGI